MSISSINPTRESSIADVCGRTTESCPSSCHRDWRYGRGVRHRCHHQRHRRYGRSDGIVVGVDRDRGLLERARAHCVSRPNLRFEEADATSLDYDARFDVVTAARTFGGSPILKPPSVG